MKKIFGVKFYKKRLVLAKEKTKLKKDLTE